MRQILIHRQENKQKEKKKRANFGRKLKTTVIYLRRKIRAKKLFL